MRFDGRNRQSLRLGRNDQQVAGVQQLRNITSLPEEHDVPTEPGLGDDRFACRTLGSVARDQQQGIRTLAHDGWHRLQHLAVPLDSMHAANQQQDASLRRDSQGPMQSLPCSCRHGSRSAAVRSHCESRGHVPGSRRRTALRSGRLRRTRRPPCRRAWRTFAADDRPRPRERSGRVDAGWFASPRGGTRFAPSVSP